MPGLKIEGFEMFDIRKLENNYYVVVGNVAGAYVIYVNMIGFNF